MRQIQQYLISSNVSKLAESTQYLYKNALAYLEQFSKKRYGMFSFHSYLLMI